MSELYLLRHAKAAPQTDGLRDMDRPLEERGREGARAVAAWLKRQRIAPELMLCSTTVRTRANARRDRRRVPRRRPSRVRDGGLSRLARAPAGTDPRHSRPDRARHDHRPQSGAARAGATPRRYHRRPARRPARLQPAHGRTGRGSRSISNGREYAGAAPASSRW